MGCDTSIRPSGRSWHTLPRFSREQREESKTALLTERSGDVQIVGLRKKLRDLGRLIETVRGVGYRFREECFRHSNRLSGPKHAKFQ